MSMLEPCNGINVQSLSTRHYLSEYHPNTTLLGKFTKISRSLQWHIDWDVFENQKTFQYLCPTCTCFTGEPNEIFFNGCKTYGGISPVQLEMINGCL